ncbi:MAG: NADH:flavin oxidoreductase [Dehalococcoidales bacterium]|nr:NADH:flavin oxidoreductase [Dehalococcoidales bacterium]
MARLDEPLAIKAMRLPNRLALAPTTCNYADENGLVTDANLGYYRPRSRDLGLVIVESCAVRADGRIAPGSIGSWDDRQIPGLKRLVDTIKGEGAATILQLNHAGARSSPLAPGIAGPSPSGVAFRPDVPPTPLSERQIGEFVAGYAAAAKRAQQAGFDGVEVHGAHLYLISQFLSPLANKRTDRYGGDGAARATFAAEVIGAIRKGCGADFPIVFRLNAVEAVEGGQTLDDAVVAARVAAKAGADAIHVSALMQAEWLESNGQKRFKGVAAPRKEMPFGAYAPYAARIKGAVSVPVIAVGKLADHTVAGELLAEGVADVIAICRQLIVDPHTATKMLAGHSDEIVRCDECMGCFTSIQKPGPLKCTVNRDLIGEPQYKNRG